MSIRLAIDHTVSCYLLTYTQFSTCFSRIQSLTYLLPSYVLWAQKNLSLSIPLWIKQQWPIFKAATFCASEHKCHYSHFRIRTPIAGFGLRLAMNPQPWDCEASALTFGSLLHTVIPLKQVRSHLSKEQLVLKLGWTIWYVFLLTGMTVTDYTHLLDLKTNQFYTVKDSYQSINIFVPKCTR